VLGPALPGAQNVPRMKGVAERGRGPQIGLGLGLGLGLAVTAFGCCALALAPPAGSLDDVFVVLAEARRLVSTSDLGAEGPTVESWTSPADLLGKMALLVVWPGADPLRAAGWLALAELAIFVGASVALLAALGGGGVRCTIAAFGLISVPGLLEGAAYRLEGPLFGLVWMLAATAAMRRRFRGALGWGALLAWIRPEGMALGLAAAWLARPSPAGPLEEGLTSGHVAGEGRSGTSLREPLRGRRWTLAVSALLIVVPVTAFRRTVYGAWLPNTYHAKRSDSLAQEWMDGAEYAAQLVAGSGGLALVTLAVIAALRFGAARREGHLEGAHIQRVALWLAGLSLAALVASGGDSYEGARLALPIGVPLWLGFAAPRGFGRPARFAQVLLGLGAAALALQSWALIGGSVSAETVRMRLSAARSGPAGMEVFAPERPALRAATLALDGEAFGHRHLQRLRWFCPDASVLDLTGLTDRSIARLPAPGQVKFGRDAVEEALRRRAGALHLDPVGVRPLSITEVDLLPALASPTVAPNFGGPPYLDRDTAARVAAAYFGASFAVPGGFVNLLVRQDLAPRFVEQGFTVSGDAAGRR